ncbi:MAG: Xaa-Pro aminopeptidase [Thermomicrobiales bacterium]|nr:Xaa-Pro aminopeptidase [Thermomicrobiales bacterium]
MPDVVLRHVPLPDESAAPGPPAIAAGEYERRCDETLARAGTPWVAVYGDREHSANLLFLTGFDPRFEEALLLLGPAGQRVLLVGNEGVVHAAIAGLPLEVRLFQGFSLMGQPRDAAPSLARVLKDVGLETGDEVGVIGWKYLTAAETFSDPRLPAWAPTILTDALDHITGVAPVDVTAVLMNPGDGLRASNGADQIAAFAWAALRASQAVFRVVQAARTGMTERDIAANMRYAGEPLSMHPIVASGSPGEAINGLRSPSGREVSAGDGITCGIGYWGSLCCRAGLLEQTVPDGFFNDYVKPYFLAQAAWYAAVGIGVTGDDVFAAVEGALADAGAAFRPMLNPGHLISYDEWVHSPIERGSKTPLASGMALQCDIIPTPLPPGTALNCEDTVVLADAALRHEIAARHPELWARIGRTRDLMRDELGLTLRPETLPLSLANAYLPPGWLAPDRVCALA